MNPKEVAAQLNENERKLLLALKDKNAAKTTELGLELNLSKDAVEKASSWAETKGVVSFKEEISRSFRLTDEGEKYATEGLPEKNLIKLVAGGITELSKLRTEVSSINIALVWVRSNGWAEIKSGKIELTEEGKKRSVSNSTDEEILELMYKKVLPEKGLFFPFQARMPVLIKRGLVKIEEETEKWVETTDFGKEVVPFIEALGSKPVITQLTQEILQSGIWKNVNFQHYDISLPTPNLALGKRHFISQVIDYIRRFWVELGFKEMKGSYLELSFWNFDALYQPQDHPARDLADTFYMKIPYSG
ncbi:hypothetical protein JW865_07120, partial [Candidatus Bathyarchaeota archaeon]|nr:hypothetical protein [Candidatus Bathyarchaeota archaeon]